MDYINTIQCLSSLALIFLTAVLAYETRLLRKSETDPNVILYLRPNEINYGLIELVLENAGKGVAKDIEIQFDNNLLFSDGRSFANIGFLQGVSVLAPGQRLVTFIEVIIDEDKVANMSTSGSIQFYSDKGTKMERGCYINFNELFGVSNSWSPAFAIADALERIAVASGAAPGDVV